MSLSPCSVLSERIVKATLFTPETETYYEKINKKSSITDYEKTHHHPSLCTMVVQNFHAYQSHDPCYCYWLIGRFYTALSSSLAWTCAHAGLFECFHKPPKSDMDSRILNVLHVIFLHGWPQFAVSFEGCLVESAQSFDWRILCAGTKPRIARSTSSIMWWPSLIVFHFWLSRERESAFSLCYWLSIIIPIRTPPPPPMGKLSFFSKESQLQQGCTTQLMNQHCDAE